MKFIALAVLLLVTSAVSAADLVPEVPSQFTGEWNAKLSDCGTGENDSVLRIFPNRISFYETEGPVEATVVHGRYEIALIAELSGEGQTWLATFQYRLSPDEQQLTVDAPGSGLVRYRCPHAGL